MSRALHPQELNRTFFHHQKARQFSVAASANHSVFRAIILPFTCFQVLVPATLQCLRVCRMLLLRKEAA
jgi:hypothetical protein